MRRHIVLIGMMGAGKTAVGSDLARRLGIPFLDTDAEIERAANMTIPEIFARDGEAFFRARESEVLARVLNGPQAVISTGGGAWMRDANREAMRARGLVVWLDADLDTLWQRVRARPSRPLLQTADPQGTLARLHGERAPVYALADLTVVAQRSDSVDETSRKVIAAIAAHSPSISEKK